MTDVGARLNDVRERMATACSRAGRSADSVRLVAVSKRIPLAEVVAACRAGQRDLGENRVQELLTRQDELAALLAAADLPADHVRWHFIGHLQTNKAGKIAGRCTLLHAIDSYRLAAKLSDRNVSSGVTDRVLVEVNISGEAQKHGLSPDVVCEEIHRMASLPGLRVDGLMGMARYGADESELRATFATLRRLAERARSACKLPLPELSMGMSADFEAAIAEGATIVRVGGAIFGPRAY